MTRKEKEKEVEWLREQFQGLKALVLTNFSGLTVAEMNELRSQLRDKGASLKVVKNTLVRRAMPGTDVSHLADHLEGPRAAAWTQNEHRITDLAKTLTEFAKAHPKMEVVRGVVGTSVLDAKDLDALSKLPPREVLVGRLLGTMIAPVAAFVNTLAAVPRSFLSVLKAIEDRNSSPSEPAAG
ncbi:MAG: 50S ribosomal protein L10 [Pseudomonadota bacterium]